MNTTSASYVLKPLSLAEILDQAIRLYRNNFFKFIGILAIPYIPLIVLQTAMSALMTSSSTDILSNPVTDPMAMFQRPGYLAGALGVFAGIILQFILVQSVATAAVTRSVADSYMGRSTGILEAYQKLGNAWARLLLALLFVIVVVIIISMWFIIVPCLGWFTGGGMLLFMTSVVIPLIAPVIVLERHGAIMSLRRAWDLSRSRFWWLLGFAFILYLFAQIVITGPTYLVSALLNIVLASQGSLEKYTLLSTVIQTLVTMIFSLLYLPLQLTAMTVVYFDLRVRTEGLDLALQSAETAGGETASSFLPEITPGPQGGLITGTEFLYFLLIELGIIAIYFILFAVLAGVMMALMPSTIP